MQRQEIAAALTDAALRYNFRRTLLSQPFLPSVIL